ncbi:hypothetical protein BROUX41_000731 [Berkeleyomyces rouxiae]
MNAKREAHLRRNRSSEKATVKVMNDQPPAFELLTAAKDQADQAKDALDLERQEHSDRASKVTMEMLERKNWSFFISGEAILSGPRNWSNWHGSVARSLWELRLRIEDVQLVHEEVLERLLILLRSTVSQDLLSKIGAIYDFAEAVEVLRNETAGRMSQSQEIFDEKFRRFRFLPGENLHKMVLRFEDLAAEATSLGVSLPHRKSVPTWCLSSHNISPSLPAHSATGATGSM